MKVGGMLLGPDGGALLGSGRGRGNGMWSFVVEVDDMCRINGGVPAKVGGPRRPSGALAIPVLKGPRFRADNPIVWELPNSSLVCAR